MRRATAENIYFSKGEHTYMVRNYRPEHIYRISYTLLKWAWSPSLNLTTGDALLMCDMLPKPWATLVRPEDLR